MVRKWTTPECCYLHFWENYIFEYDFEIVKTLKISQEKIYNYAFMVN